MFKRYNIVLIGVITLLVVLTNISSVNSEIMNDYYGYTINDVNKKYKVYKVVDKIAGENDIVVANTLRYNDEIIIYANDNFFKIYGLNPKNEYTNKLGENYLTYPNISKVKLKTWDKIEEYTKYKGEFTFITGDDADLASFDKELKTLGLETATIVLENNFQDKIQIFQVIVIVLLVIYLFLILVKINREQKKMIIYTLSGNSKWDILKKNQKKIKVEFITQEIAMLIVVIILNVIFHMFIGKIFVKEILLLTLINIGLIACYYMILFALMSKSKIYSLIKGEQLFKYVNQLAISLKFIMQILIIIMVVVVSYSFGTIVQDLPVIKNWQKVEEFYTSDNAGITGLESDEYDQTKDFTDRKNYVSYMERNAKGMYVYSLSGNKYYRPYDQTNKMGDSTIVANYNFLDFMGVISKDKYDEHQARLLIPEKYYNDKEKIEKEFNEYWKELSFDDNMSVLDYKTSSYSNQEIYSYDYKSMEETNDYFINPIIYIPSTNNEELNIMTYAFQSLMFTDETGEGKKIVKQYYEDKKIKYHENDLEVFSKYLEFATFIYQRFLVVLFAIIISIITYMIYGYLYQIVISVYIKNNSLKILNNKLIGKKKYQIYRKLYVDELISTIVLTIMLISILFILRIIISDIITLPVIFIAFVLLVIYIIINTVFLSYQIRKNENKALIKIIKGDVL